MSIPGEVTPHRHTVADLYRVDDRVQVRPYWTERRHASEINRAPSDRWGASTGVLYVPGDAWILKPHQGDLPRVVEDGVRRLASAAWTPRRGWAAPSGTSTSRPG